MSNWCRVSVEWVSNSCRVADFSNVSNLLILRRLANKSCQVSLDFEIFQNGVKSWPKRVRISVFCYKLPLFSVIDSRVLNKSERIWTEWKGGGAFWTLRKTKRTQQTTRLGFFIYLCSAFFEIISYICTIISTEGKPFLRPFGSKRP